MSSTTRTTVSISKEEVTPRLLSKMSLRPVLNGIMMMTNMTLTVFLMSLKAISIKANPTITTTNGARSPATECIIFPAVKLEKPILSYTTLNATIMIKNMLKFWQKMIQKMFKKMFKMTKWMNKS